jgi:parvulin-like peptidyl-prolyl isomerase
MIKLIREGSRKYPWILVSIMGVIVVTFVVGMGWWGYGQTAISSVATVGDMSISIEEYRRAYRNLQDALREDGKEVTDDEVRQRALERLITTKLWYQGAQDLGIVITPEELRADIIKTEAFHQDGKFHPEIYHRRLARERLTPAYYEELRRRDLVVDKAITLVMDSVALTPEEEREAKALMPGDPSMTSSGPLPMDFLFQTFRFQKQQRALEAYTEMLKGRFPIEVYRENM